MSRGAALRVMLSELRSMRLDPAAVCAEARIDPRAPENACVPLGAADLARALERAEAAARDPLLGLHMAERATGRGVLAYLARSQSTVGEALQAFARHAGERWGPGAGVRLERCAGTTAVVFRLEDVLSRHVVEYLLARTAISLRRSGAVPREAWFQHPPGGTEREYLRVLGCPVRFRRSENRLALRSADLARSLRTANPEAAELLASALARRTAQRPRSASAQLAAAVVAALDRGVPLDREALARSLGMSGRTLARRLSAERRCFRDVVDEERRRLAERFVLERALDLGAVAARLGFADASAFGKAFRRWFSVSPTAFRALRSVRA